MDATEIQSDHEVFHQGVKSYQKIWGRKRDKTKYDENERSARRGSIAVGGVESFYDFITIAYLDGWGEHFHFTPFAPDEPIKQAMAFFAHKLANTMGLKPGMKVLDVGCGVGGPAREIAKFIGCEIVGININQGHIDRAVEMTAQAGLSHLVSFVKGDFMDMPFAAASFDAAYAIEATAHAPSLPQVYKNIHKVLKPEGIFLTSEWVMTPEFNPSNESHIKIRNHIERGNAVPSLPLVSHARQSLIAAPFNILYEEDYAHHWKTFLHYPEQSSSATSPDSYLSAGKTSSPDPTSASSALASTTTAASTTTTTNPIKPRPKSKPKYQPKIHPSSRAREWYYPLLGQTHLTANQTDWFLTWKMSKIPRKTSYWILRILEKCHAYPRGVTEAMDIVREAVDALAEGGQKNIFSPCWWFVCQKVVGDGSSSEEKQIGSLAGALEGK